MPFSGMSLAGPTCGARQSAGLAVQPGGRLGLANQVHDPQPGERVGGERQVRGAVMSDASSWAAGPRWR